MLGLVAVKTDLPVLGQQESRNLRGASFSSSSRVTDGSEDAVRVSLKSRKASAADTALYAKGLSSSNGEISGALEALKDIAKQMGAVKDKLASEADPRISAALNRELQNLTTNYQGVLQSDTYQLTSQILSMAQASLKRGVSGRALANAYSPQAGLLGSHLMGVIQQGDLAAIQGLGEALSGIGRLDPTSEDFEKALNDYIESAQGVLSGPEFSQAQQEQEPISAELRVVAAPKGKQLAFADANGLALGLRTMDAKDMILAAAAHVDLDNINSVVLLSEPDRGSNQHKTKAEPESTNDKTALSDHTDKKVALEYNPKVEVPTEDPDEQKKAES